MVLQFCILARSRRLCCLAPYLPHFTFSRMPSRLHPCTSHPRTRAPFLDGFTINIFNPSITSFYVGVTPTFLVPGATWRSLAMLYLAHISIAFTCHVFWSSLFNQARTFFAGERPRRWLDGIVGVILIWLAIRIIRTI